MLNSIHLSLVNKSGDKTEFTITRVHCIWCQFIQHLEQKYQWSISFAENFSLCQAFDSSSENDIANFFASIVGILQGAVQYDFNGPIDCETVCSIMTDDSIVSPLERMIELNR